MQPGRHPLSYSGTCTTTPLAMPPFQPYASAAATAATASPTGRPGAGVGSEPGSGSGPRFVSVPGGALYSVGSAPMPLAAHPLLMTHAHTTTAVTGASTSPGLAASQTSSAAHASPPPPSPTTPAAEHHNRSSSPGPISPSPSGIPAPTPPLPTPPAQPQTPSTNPHVKSSRQATRRLSDTDAYSTAPRGAPHTHPTSLLVQLDLTRTQPRPTYARYLEASSPVYDEAGPSIFLPGEEQGRGRGQQRRQALSSPSAGVVLEAHGGPAAAAADLAAHAAHGHVLHEHLGAEQPAVSRGGPMPTRGGAITPTRGGAITPTRGGAVTPPRSTGLNQGSDNAHGSEGSKTLMMPSVGSGSSVGLLWATAGPARQQRQGQGHEGSDGALHHVAQGSSGTSAAAAAEASGRAFPPFHHPTQAPSPSMAVAARREAAAATAPVAASPPDQLPPGRFQRLRCLAEGGAETGPDE